jgi:aminoglycoside phosphotransferase (APT) family kinase protein
MTPPSPSPSPSPAPAEPWAVEAPPELAPVRPGESLPWDRLRAWLVPALADAGVGVDGPMDVQQFPNGSANLTYLLSFGPARFVLRRPPFGEIAPGAHDMKREYRVLSELWRGFDRSPRAYAFCDDHDVVGSDFVVSEYRPGEVVWSTLPASLRGLPGVARRIGFATVDALADLHLVDPAGVALSELGRPAGYLERQLTGWRTRWSLVATPDLDTFVSGLGERLESLRPPSPAPTLLHNDFKLDNCQFTPGAPDRVTSVFDWDQATLGDPLADVGMLLNYWPDPADTDGDRPLHVPGLERLGLPSRAEVAARYADRTGADLSGIAWYEAFATWKNAVVTQQLYQRWARGESTDERMKQRGAYPPMLAARTARLLDALEAS